ncbi:asparagine synthase (glutamine-hydrolyzing) [bacterium]|nr:asparagine synthase (glutamine-hydrolyzing) [bacterium]
MCGICGFINTDLDREKHLGQMLDRMIHRGPDHRGVYHNHTGVSLGIQRLAIIDLVSGNQPIFNEDKSLVVVFNGEIFNYRELRQDLIAHNHHFYTEGDAEVLVHLFEQYGNSMVQKLRGQFAFAIWDEKKKRLLAGRDRFGIKPLYYHRRGEGLVFASEPQAIFRAPWFSPEINRVALDSFLSFRAVPQPDHIIKDIQAVPPGHLLHFEAGQLMIEQYWSYPQPLNQTENWSDQVDMVEQLLTDAIRYRLVSDVPIGVMLSGGIDSALIVALVTELTGQRFKTFFLGFGDGADYCNEDQYARTVSELYQTEHYEYFLTSAEVARDLNTIIARQPQPCGDGIQKFYVSRLVSDQVKVALSGSGGDELFAGYQWYSQITSKRFYDTLAALVPSAVKKALLPRFSNDLTGPERVKKLAQLLDQGDFIGRYNAYKSLFKDGEKDRLYLGHEPDPALARIATRARLQQLDLPVRNLSEVDRIAWLQIQTDLTDLILLNEDAMSMAHSVELRLPYLDHVLAEYVAGLQYTSKVKGTITKYSLKKIAEKYLPEQIVHRPKHGFIMPLTEWLQSDLKPYLDSVFSREAVERRGLFAWDSLQKIYTNFQRGREGCYRVWNLIVLELWLRVHLDGQDLHRD